MWSSNHFSTSSCFLCSRVQAFQGPGFSGSRVFKVQVFQGPSFSRSRFFRVQFLQGPGPGSGSRFQKQPGKTSNFNMCLLNFIFTCHFRFIQKIIYHSKRNLPRFSLMKFCCISIYFIAIVKFNNRPIQNLLNFSERISMDFCQVIHNKKH